MPVQRGREGPLSIDEKQIVALATELISEVTSKMTRGDKARQVASLDVQQTLAMAHGRHSFAGAPSLVMLASPSRYRLTLAAPRDPI